MSMRIQMRDGDEIELEVAGNVVKVRLGELDEDTTTDGSSQRLILDFPQRTLCRIQDPLTRGIMLKNTDQISVSVGSMSTEENEMEKQESAVKHEVKCAVFGDTEHGPDVLFVRVSCTDTQLGSGVHYRRAAAFAETMGLETPRVLDQHDPGRRILDGVSWSETSLLEVRDFN